MRRFRNTLLLGNVVVFSILVGTVADALYESHEGYETRNRQTATNLAHAMSLNIGAEIKQIDNALRSVALQINRVDRRAEAAREAVSQIVEEQRSMIPQIEVIRVTYPEGNVVNTDEKLSVADRDYFRSARNSPKTIVISEPLRGRITKEWGIVVARARVDADGRFMGIVYSNIWSDRFVDEFDDLALGPRGAVSLRSSTLRLIARYTPDASNPYAAVGTDSVSEQLRAAIEANPNQGVFLSRTPVDGVERINAYERVIGLPLLLFVGSATDDFFAPWKAEVERMLGLAALLELALVGLSLWIYNQHRRQMELQRATLRLAEEREALLDNELVGAVRLIDGKEVWHNKALASLFGYAPGELSGRSSRIFYRDDESYAQVESAYADVADHAHFRTQIRMMRKDGRPIWVDLSGARLPNGESLWMMLDVSGVKDSEVEARHRASHDPLTGLFNRAAFLEILEEKLGEAERSGHPLAVCYIDLDGFKEVNDTHGHDAGDRILKEAAHRIVAGVRSNDIVARLGGDEFAALLCDMLDRAETPTVLQRLVKNLIEPIAVRQGEQVVIGASVGAAIYAVNGEDAELLLRRADVAMYEAKRAGKNRFVVYGRSAAGS